MGVKIRDCHGELAPIPNIVYPHFMAKTPKKKTPKAREDVNTMAYRIMLEATGQASKTPDPDAGKDPAAVALGKKGGAKGGKARAAGMTAKQRTASAKKAAAARWEKSAP